MAEHAKLSPSASDRWRNCPGSVSLSETVPRPPSSEYAIEGTAAHKLLEYHLLDADVSMDEIEVNDRMILVTQDMRDAVRVAVNYVNDRCNGGTSWTEERVCATSIDPDLWGTVDAAIWHEEIGLLEIIDYKHGYNVVEVEGNSQLCIYAIGFVDTHIGNWDDVEFIKYTIIQPRAPHHDGPIRSEMLTREQAEAFIYDMKDAITLTKANDPILKIGDWCRWCPVNAAGACPKQNDQAKDMFSKLEEATDDGMAVQDSGRLAKLQDMVAQLEQWCKQISGATKQAIESGEDVPGWKVVDGRATRKWTDEPTAAKYFKKTVGAFTAPQLKSPAQMEKIVSKALVNEHCSKISTTTALVPASDKRPAKQFKLMFEALS